MRAGQLNGILIGEALFRHLGNILKGGLLRFRLHTGLRGAVQPGGAAQDAALEGQNVERHLHPEQDLAWIHQLDLRRGDPGADIQAALRRDLGRVGLELERQIQ